jgi:hypothetical protein
MTIEQLAEIILKQRQAALAEQYSQDQADAERVSIVPGRVYTKIDRGPAHNMSGFLMVENATGRIYGIKAYGKVHKGHYYGTLDTADLWYWGAYGPRPCICEVPPTGPDDVMVASRKCPVHGPEISV